MSLLVEKILGSALALMLAMVGGLMWWRSAEATEFFNTTGFFRYRRGYIRGLGAVVCLFCLLWTALLWAYGRPD